MGNGHGTTLYSGKAQLVARRSRAVDRFDQDAIEDFFEQACRRSRPPGPIRVIVRGSSPAGHGSRAWAARADDPRVSKTERPESAKPDRGTSSGKTAAPRPVRSRAGGSVDKPILMLRPRHVFETRSRGGSFSIVQLGYGLALGTAAALLSVWLIDAVIH